MAAVAVYHVNNVFRVTVYMVSNMSSLAGRMKCVTRTSVCICSSDETFKLRTNELKTYLNKRGYNLSFLNQEIGRVNGIQRCDAIATKDTSYTNKPIRVPLVITYNPALRSVSSIIHKHFNILSSSPRCANVFKATPLVAFRRTNNLSDLLVSAKLRNPTQKTHPIDLFDAETTV